MSNPTAVSDIERQEHDASLGVKKTINYGSDGNNAVTLKTDSDGHLQVDVLSEGTNYATEIRTSGNYTYIGKAAIGSATSAAVWQIKRLDTTNTLTKKWASGSDAFNQIFDNYGSISFS